MNRTIKFRAFDEHTKKIFPVCGLYYDDGKLFMIGIDTGDISLLRVTCEDKIELMQYVGLKDSGGVEICEGDILSGVHGQSGKIKNYTVEIPDIYYMQEGGIWNDKKIKIIGNIYENPELKS